MISSYGTSLAQRASYLALRSSFFAPVAQLIMIILSLTALTGLRCILNGTHTNNFEPIWPKLRNLSKTLTQIYTSTHD